MHDFLNKWDPYNVLKERQRQAALQAEPSYFKEPKAMRISPEDPAFQGILKPDKGSKAGADRSMGGGTGVRSSGIP